MVTGTSPQTHPLKYVHQHSGYIQSAMSSCMLRITCTQVFYACGLMMCACYNIDKTTNIQSMIISNNICFSFMVYVKTRVFTSSSKHEESWDDELFGSCIDDRKQTGMTSSLALHQPWDPEFAVMDYLELHVQETRMVH